jgi:hypothetical protein
VKQILYIGLDVHKESISIALAEAGRKGEVRSYGKISNDPHAMEKVVAPSPVFCPAFQIRAELL